MSRIGKPTKSIQIEDPDLPLSYPGVLKTFQYVASDKTHAQIVPVEWLCYLVIMLL